MPILDAEPDQFPADLFALPTDAGTIAEADLAPDGAGRRWVVAHTRPRQEKAVARELFSAGVPFYLPCDRRRTKVRAKVVTSRPPLFAGYVFARVGEADRGRVQFNPRVASVLQVHDQTRLWADLRRVRGVLDLGQPVTPEKTLEPGTPVTLREGPLTGMSGVIVKAAGGFKFVVQVDFIRQGLSVVVDGASLGVSV
jgi:transcriptional antiterminator RfaH